MHLSKVIGFVLLASFLGFMQEKPTTPVAEALDGVYQFASEKTELVEPNKTTTTKIAPEWEGVWLFQKGYYSTLISQKGREAIFNEKSNKGLGAFAYAGKYDISDGKLTLHQDFAISPLEVNRSMVLDFKRQGDVLILTRELHPYIEDIRKGAVTTILKKIN